MNKGCLLPDEDVYGNVEELEGDDRIGKRLRIKRVR